MVAGLLPECPRLDALVRFALQKIREIIVFVPRRWCRRGCYFIAGLRSGFQGTDVTCPFGKIDAVLISTNIMTMWEVWTTYVLSVVSERYLFMPKRIRLSVCVAGCLIALWNILIREFRIFLCVRLNPIVRFLLIIPKCYLEGNARQTAHSGISDRKARIYY